MPVNFLPFVYDWKKIEQWALNRTAALKKKRQSLFVFSQAGVSWRTIDGGWWWWWWMTNAWMNEWTWMDEGTDDGWWNGLWKQGLKSLFCQACMVELHPAISCNRVRSWRSRGMMARTNANKQTRKNKTGLWQHQHHWSDGWVKGLAWWWNNSCPVNNGSDDWLQQ